MYSHMYVKTVISLQECNECLLLKNDWYLLHPISSSYTNMQTHVSVHKQSQENYKVLSD